MNTTKKGSIFEEEIYNFFKREIISGQFIATPECCKIFKQKSYFSKDRESNIIFDIAIEISFPNSENYSILFLIECKNYKHPVGVEDLEEFFSKTQQVAASNSKAVLVTPSSFRKSARSFAKSKGIGLLRYFAENDFEWTLRRTRSQNHLARELKHIDEALDEEDFSLACHHAYIQTPLRLTQNISDLITDFLHQNNDFEKFSDLLSPEKLISNKLKVPYLSKEFINEIALDILNQINYEDGEVDLEKICNIESEKHGLKIIHDNPKENMPYLLGEILFYKNEIHLYYDSSTEESQKRFSLAHELGHYFLNHGKHIYKEELSKVEIDIFTYKVDDFNDTARLEFQANYFAACLLMPNSHVNALLNYLLNLYNIKNRGFAHLYLDKQACNTNAYFTILNVMMEYFGVSRAALTNKLEELDLLVRG